MSPADFAKTIYLGDRGCKSILIDGWKDEVKIQITCISRVRSNSWDFYTDEDLENGSIVFSAVKWCSIEPPGCIPNGYIDFVSIEEIDDSLYEFVFSVGATSEGSCTIVAKLLIRASNIYLEDERGGAIRV